MEFQQILQMIDQVSKSALTSFRYEGDGIKVSMKCGEKVRSASFPDGKDKIIEDKISLKEAKTEGRIIKSPLVGTFYAAPSETAAPFVKAGDQVKKGQILAIVEAMKLMNEIESEFDGQITEVFVENGCPVEYGQKLFLIK